MFSLLRGGCLYSEQPGREVHWNTISCDTHKFYVCEFPQQKARSQRLSFGMLHESIHVWMKLKEVPLETLHKREQTPGFKMSWRVENGQH